MNYEKDDTEYIKRAWLFGWQAYWADWSEGTVEMSGHPSIVEHRKAGWIAAKEFAEEAEYRAEKYASEHTLNKGK